MRAFLLLFTVALSGCGGSTPETTEAPPPPPPVEKYAIKIHRPFTTGQVVGIDVEVHQSAKAAVEGEEQDLGTAEHIDIHLVGDVTITEVAPDGRAAAATLTVTSFVNPKDQSVILPPGSVVQAKRVDGELVAVLEGGTLTAFQQWYLKLAFPLERPGGRVGDALFGTPEPRAIGESWPFDRAFVIESLHEKGFVVSETGIDGVVTLQKIAPCGKTQCLELLVDMKAGRASMLATEGSDTIGTGDLHSTITLQVPVDETTPVHVEDAMHALTFMASYKKGDETTERQVAAVRSRRATYLPKD